MALLRHWKPLLAATVLVLVAANLVELFVLQPMAGGLTSLDFRVLGFTTGEVEDWLDRLDASASGRSAVIWLHYATIDLLLPALLTVTLAAMTIAAGNRLNGFAALPTRVQAMVAVGLALPYAILDYAQNIAVVGLLNTAGPVGDGAVSLASGLNVAKFALLAVPIAVIAVLFLAGHKKHGGSAL